MMVVSCSIFIIGLSSILQPLVWADDSIEPSFDQRLHPADSKLEVKPSDGEPSYLIENKRYFLPMRGRKNSLYDISGSSEFSNTNDAGTGQALVRGLASDTVDLPKRAFIPLRGRKGEMPFYRAGNAYYPSFDGYRKKAAFTGMRGKKMHNSPMPGDEPGFTGNLRQIYDPLDDIWSQSKRARSFPAMRGKRALSRGMRTSQGEKIITVKDVQDSTPAEDNQATTTYRDLNLITPSNYNYFN